MDIIELKIILEILSSKKQECSLSELQKAVGGKDKIKLTNLYLDKAYSENLIQKVHTEKSFKKSMISFTLKSEDYANLKEVSPQEYLFLNILKEENSLDIESFFKKLPLKNFKTIKIKREVLEKCLEKNLCLLSLSQEHEKLMNFKLTEKAIQKIYQEPLENKARATLKCKSLITLMNLWQKRIKENTPLKNELALPTLEEIFEIIQDIEKRHQTKNYTPLYLLREELSYLERKTQDELIFKLIDQDKIYLSSLQDVSSYSKEQINSGIPQIIGGPLFFICIKKGI